MKIGDEVTIVANTMYGHCLKIGGIGTIVSIDMSHPTQIYIAGKNKRNGNNITQVVAMEDIEPIKEDLFDKLYERLK